MHINEKHKSSVFSILFSNPEVLRELYSALQGVSIPHDTPVDINTLSNILVKGKINDLSFTIDNRLVVLIEHQSTINHNMPLRLLIYITSLYQKLIDSKTLYRQRRIGIPSPEFIVLYNGKDPYPEKTEVKLSQMFKDVQDLKPDSVSLELTVRVFNINYGKNPEILEKSEVLSGYSLFIEKIREFQKTFPLERSVISALKYCIKHNILKEFLEQNSSEVINMMLEDWNWEDARDVWREEAREEGLEQGIKQGREEGIEQGRKQGLEQGREEGIELGAAKEQKYILELLNQGLSAEELKERLRSGGKNT